MGFAGAGRAEEDQVPPGGHEVECAQVRDDVALEVAWLKSKSSSDLRAGNLAARIASSPAIPGHHRQHRQLIRRPHLPEPGGTCTGGNQKSHCAISSAARLVRTAGSGGRHAGRHCASFPLSARIEYGHPTRTAITVDGIDENAFSSSRIRGSNASATDPCGVRTHFGGLSLASAAFTVVREIPSTRAISAIGHALRPPQPTDLSRVPHAQHLPLPGSARARVSEKLVNFRLPRPGQYSVFVDIPPRWKGNPGSILTA